MILWTLAKGLVKLIVLLILIFPALILAFGGDERLMDWMIGWCG